MPARMPARKRNLLAAAITAAACLTAQALALTTAGPATASTSASDEVISRGVTIPEFYNPPSTLPAADGTLVRSEPLPSP